MNLVLISLFTIGANCVDILPLPKGRIAPCDGILWTIDASKKALACRQVEIPKLEAECLAFKGTLEAERTAHGEQIDALDAQVLGLEKEIVELKKPDPWFMSAKLWVPVSFLTGTALGIYIGGL